MNMYFIFHHFPRKSQKSKKDPDFYQSYQLSKTTTRILRTTSMLKIIATFFFLFTAFFANAQTASFQWTDWKYNTDVGFQDPVLTLSSDEGFTTYSIEELGTQVFAPKIIYISTFDSAAKLKSTVSLALPKRQRKEATLLKVIEGEKKLDFCSQMTLKKDKKHVLYVQVDEGTTE